VVRRSEAQASDDIWHLSIEDLFTPASAPARSTCPGPFVINLRTSSMTINPPPGGLLCFDRLHVYQLARSHEGRPQFRLRIGIIESELEADAILESVRAHYPRAIKETAENDDKVAIARAVRPAAPARPASEIPEGEVAVVQAHARTTAAAAATAKTESTKEFVWDIDELLPHLAETRAPRQAQTLPKFAATEVRREPTIAPTVAPGFAKVNVQPRPTAMPTHVERREPPVAPNRVLRRPHTPATPEQPLVRIAPVPTVGSRGPLPAEDAPTLAGVEELDSDPNAVTDEVKALDLRLLEVPTLKPAAPDRDPQHDGKDRPPAYAVTADHASVMPRPDSAADSGTLERLVVKIGALIDSAETHGKSPNAPIAQTAPAASTERVAPEVASRRPAAPPAPVPVLGSVSARAGTPVMDSTQTVRALTPFELADGEASRWFVIQLMLCEEQIDAEQVPNLNIFEEYQLYSATGLYENRVMHALRLGFFSSEIAAEAVTVYLAAYFDSPSIKRVSIAERERFADRRVAPRKDVGESGEHTVIELVGPAPLPEPRVDPPPVNSDKPAAPESTSLWSRLLAPLGR
jgi:hypothetical protein